MTAAEGAGTVPADRARLDRARWSITGVFFVVGLALSAWFTQIPQFKAALGLSDARLGFALLFPAAGALVSMQVAGRLARRHGSAQLVRIACLGLAGSLPLVGASRGFGFFIAALFLFGLADGMLDVSMNSHAIAVEAALGRPVLQSMHAAFSLGTIVGALSGGASIWAHVDPLGFMAGVAVSCVVVTAAASTGLLPSSVDREQRAPDGDSDPGAAGPDAGGRPELRRRAAGWTTFVIVLGLLGAGCLLAEGAAESWGAVFLRDQRHAAPVLGSAAYLIFTAVQFGGRMIGDRLHRRWGSVLLVRRGAVVAATGLCLQLLAPQPALACCGIAVYSLGLSVLVPIIFSAVGHGSAAEHGSASTTAAVARFTTLSYLGYLLGPAAIGWLAQGIGLTWALSTVLLVLAAVFGFARWTGSALPGGTDAGDPAGTEREDAEPASGLPAAARPWPPVGEAAGS
jgi:MFS family permease